MNDFQLIQLSIEYNCMRYSHWGHIHIHTHTHTNTHTHTHTLVKDSLSTVMLCAPSSIFVSYENQLFRSFWKCRSLSSFIEVILSFCAKRTGKFNVRSIFLRLGNIFDRWNRELGRHFLLSLTQAFSRRKINTWNLQISTGSTGF